MAHAILAFMKSVWTRDSGAGTEAHLARSPVASFPCVHKISLPTPWEGRCVEAYLIDSQPLTLIDAGVKTPESRAALSSALEALGHGVDEIERVVVSHYHRDHVGQVQSLRDAGVSLEVWAHENAVAMVENFSVERIEDLDGTAALFLEFGAPDDLLERVNAHRREHQQNEPVLCEPTRVDHALRDGDTIPFKDFELKVIHAPGHTAGHVLLHQPDSGVLFTGDHIMNGAVPNTENYYLDGLADPRDPLRRRPRFKGLLLYRQSLRTLLRQSFETVLPGYGEVIRAPNRAIHRALLFYDVRIQRIERSLRSVTALGQAVTAYELWRALFPNDDPLTEMRTKLLMVIGALDVLEDAGDCVTSRRPDGVLVHSHSLVR